MPRPMQKLPTGKSENKFGIPISRAQEVYALAASLPGLEVIGIDVHIGSQLTDLAPFELAYQKVAELTHDLRAQGHKIPAFGSGWRSGHPLHTEQCPPSAAGRLWCNGHSGYWVIWIARLKLSRVVLSWAMLVFWYPR